MPNFYKGNPQSIEHVERIAIVVARFNETITQNLLSGCVETLLSRGVPDELIDVLHVPGAFEIPLIADLLANSANYSAIICLGCVIHGETTHDQHINRAISNSFADIARETEVPVIFGVLTCNTLEQAIARSGGMGKTTGKDIDGVKLGNKGVDAAEAALEMIDLLGQISE